MLAAVEKTEEHAPAEHVCAERGGAGHSEHYAPVRLTTLHPVGSLVRALVSATSASGLEAG